MDELVERVRAAIVHPAIAWVRLAGSRARKSAVSLSDWDFAVGTDDFEAVAEAMPALSRELDPLAAQWDRFGEHPTYMLMLEGPAKVDLLFPGHPHDDEPPWRVSAEALPRVDDHFWDWALWLAAKRQAGRDHLVAVELERMFVHLLAPLGVSGVPTTIEDALHGYVAARSRQEQRLRVRVDRRLEREVRPAIEGPG